VEPCSVRVRAGHRMVGLASAAIVVAVDGLVQQLSTLAAYGFPDRAYSGATIFIGLSGRKLAIATSVPA
jgi:hypothetical protein